jgi:lytic murein transglycosylase
MVHSLIGTTIFLGLLTFAHNIHAEVKLSPNFNPQVLQTFNTFKSDLITLAKKEHVKDEVIKQYLLSASFSGPTINAYTERFSLSLILPSSPQEIPRKFERHHVVYRRYPLARSLIKQIDRNQMLSLSKENWQLRPIRSIHLDALLGYYQRNLPLSLAREKYQQNQALLDSIQQKYGVPGNLLIAIWGAETGWGDDLGDFNIIDSLTTLSFAITPKENLYYQNLNAYISILNSQNAAILPQQLISTFDGGMGNPQFEPLSYYQYAVDFDQDGFANIWTDVPDSLASIANFLKKHGWKANASCIYKVQSTLNPTILNLAAHNKQLSIAQWKKVGLQIDPAYQNEKIDLTQKAYLIIPEGKIGPYFLALRNFHVLLHWNDSPTEALMVGIMSDLIKYPQLDWDYFRS